MNFVIIVAAGQGKRMNANENKVFLPLAGKPMISYTLKSFQNCPLIHQIVVVTRKDDIKKMNQIKEEYEINKMSLIVEGGEERQDSVYNGLIILNNARENDIIVVHNGSNPLVKENEIEECIKAAEKYSAAAAGFPLKDTIKKTNNGFVEKTLDRSNVYQMQTPQAIKYGLFMQAYKNAENKNLKATDDASLVEALGSKVKIVSCSYENIKITTPEDLRIAEGILMKRGNAGFRIGVGQDSHKFSASDKKLILGGCTIADEKGFEANSDGDVILHALFNALSSAIGERSLGFYSDSMCKNGITDSKEYLKVILNKLNEKNFRINNISVSIEASKPKLEAHTDKIKESLSKILKIEKEKIGITYTSGEDLTSFGQGDGMQCFVVVTIQ